MQRISKSCGEITGRTKIFQLAVELRIQGLCGAAQISVLIDADHCTSGLDSRLGVH
jgi:hypothetical protein